MKKFSLLAGLLLGGALWPAGADGAALEFRGVMATGGAVKVGVFDPDTGMAFWVKVPAKTVPQSAPISAGIAVREYDPAHDRLRVDYQGRTYTLVLPESKPLFVPPPPDVSPGDATGVAMTDPNNVPTGGGEAPRRQSLAQVALVNQLLRESGRAELQLPGNPEPDSPAANAAQE